MTDKIIEPADGCKREVAEAQAEAINKYWKAQGISYNARAEPVHNGIWGVRSDYVVRVG